MAVLTLALLTACRREGPDWRVKEFYAGKTSIDLLQSPARVDAFRVEPVARKPQPGETHAGPFVAASPAVELTTADAEEIARVLLDAATYEWHRGAKQEPFRPQAGLWFSRGAYTLEIALDLRTSQIGAFAGGQTLGMHAIEPGRDRLLAVLRRAFPGDAEIQSIR